jgi:hypothetical protein
MTPRNRLIGSCAALFGVAALMTFSGTPFSKDWNVTTKNAPAKDWGGEMKNFTRYYELDAQFSRLFNEKYAECEAEARSYSLAYMRAAVDNCMNAYSWLEPFNYLQRFQVEGGRRVGAEQMELRFRWIQNHWRGDWAWLNAQIAKNRSYE